MNFTEAILLIIMSGCVGVTSNVIFKILYFTIDNFIQLRLESQVNSLRDEKMKINGDLSEARIRNEQLEELKRVIENEQREKNEMQRQVKSVLFSEI